MKPYLFLHIPRTGGTSISQILPHGRTTNKNIQNLISLGEKTESEVSLQHAILDEYPDKAHELFKFTFIRNPWDRIVSAYEHAVYHNDYSISKILQNLKTGDSVEIYLTKKEKFDYFIQHVLTQKWRQGTIDSFSDGHFRSQISYTHSKNGDKIVDFIGRYENMHDDLLKLSKICDFSLDLSKISNTNKSLSRDIEYKNYYNDGNGLSRQVIYELYRDEIETFGYKF